MRKYISISVVILAALILVFAYVYFSSRRQSPISSNPSPQKMTDKKIILDGLHVPWDLAELPDNSLILTERNGTVTSISEGKIISIGEILQSAEVGEGGLLGVAVDPKFEENNHIYFYYTHKDTSRWQNRVSRFTLENDQLIQENIILDEIPGSTNHNGGRLGFGPDGMLYIGTGDAGQPSLSQNVDSLAGKVLRINKDGSVPDDNPFSNPVWAYGFRNTQGLTWNQKTGDLYATEHGPLRMDEINLIKKGLNYGWPNYQCTKQVGQKLNSQTSPIVCYDNFTLAPSDLAFINENELLVGGLKGQQLRKITLNSNLKSVSNQQIIINDVGRIRLVKLIKNKIYISTSNTDGRGTPRKNDDKIIEYTLK